MFIFICSANAITLIGSFFMAFPIVWTFANYGLSIFNDPLYPIPGWVWIMQAIMYFLYRICDEVDGK